MVSRENYLSKSKMVPDEQMGVLFPQPYLDMLDNTFHKVFATWYNLCHQQVCFTLQT